jgi:hypothetical protein
LASKLLKNEGTTNLNERGKPSRELKTKKGKSFIEK